MFKQGRSVSMISHDVRHSKIKYLWNCLIQCYGVSALLVPLHRALQIQDHLVKDQHFNHPSKNKDGAELQFGLFIKNIKKPANLIIKKLIVLIFKNLEQTIFAYRFLDELDLQPYFTKLPSPNPQNKNPYQQQFSSPQNNPNMQDISNNKSSIVKILGPNKKVQV